MNLHKHQLYLLEQHSETFKIWSTIIRINTEGKSLIMNLGPRLGVVTKIKPKRRLKLNYSQISHPTLLIISLE